MTQCSKCGRENNEAYRFCLGCGADLREDVDGPSGFGDLPGSRQAPTTTVGEPSGAADGAWRDLPEKPGFVTLAMTVTCDHCGQPVPVNGPTRRVHCANCEGETPLTRVPDELVLADQGAVVLGSPYARRTFDAAEPQCPRCGEGVPVDGWLGKAGACTTIPCPACGAGLPTYPAPDWLREKLANARQVFGGDPELAQQEAGLELQADLDEAQPVVTSCPQCSGALTITPETPRTMTCGFCGVSVFLPDALWLRLHPARRMRRWTLSFVGRLRLAGGGSPDPGEEAEALVESARQQRENRGARRQAQAEEQAQKPRRAALFLGLGLGGAGLLAVTIMVVLLVGGKGCSWSEGSLTASGPPIGDVTYTPVKCRSGQHESFRGVMLLDGADRVLIRVVQDPVQGALVNVRKPDSCRGSQCEFVRFDRQGCAVFDFFLENTNTTVNDIRIVEGHLKLDCSFKDTGGTVKADLKFKCD